MDGAWKFASASATSAPYNFTAKRFYSATGDNLAEVNFYSYCTGPFTGGQKRLKNEYVASSLKYDKL